MIKLPKFPTLGVMTGVTFRPQALLVNIDLHMAIHTFQRSVLIFCRKMTIFTGGHDMLSYQRKLGFIVIELNLLSPTLLVVAFVTFFPFLPFMYVIIAMTIKTFLTQFFLVGVTPVTIKTYQLGMTSHQLEFSILVMTEFHFGPFDKAMALVAFLFKATFMVIVTSVAIDTGTLQFFLEVVSFVTGTAFRLIMGTSKWKLGFIVVELSLRPACSVVAFIALLAKFPLMNIIERMTG